MTKCIRCNIREPATSELIYCAECIKNFYIFPNKTLRNYYKLEINRLRLELSKLLAQVREKRNTISHLQDIVEEIK